MKIDKVIDRYITEAELGKYKSYSLYNSEDILISMMNKEDVEWLVDHGRAKVKNDRSVKLIKKGDVGKIGTR